MAILPIAEMLRTQKAVELKEFERSLDLILESIKRRSLEQPEGEMSSVLMIAAFWENFCNIPPFCDRKSKDLESPESRSLRKRKPKAEFDDEF